MKNRCIKNLIILVLFLASCFAFTSVCYAMGNVVRDEEPATAEYNFDEQGIDEGGDNQTITPSTEATTETTTAAPKEQNNQAKTQKGKDTKGSSDAGKVIAKPKTVTNSVEVSKEIGDTLRVFFYSDAENLDVSCDLDGNPLALQSPVAKWSEIGKNNICFVIDTKSSISKEKWDKIKEQIISIHENELLTNDSIYIITTYKDGVLDGSETVAYANASDTAEQMDVENDFDEQGVDESEKPVRSIKDRLKDRLDEISFDNDSTNFNKSLINVGEYLDGFTDDDTRSVIIAVTDGEIETSMTASLKGRLTIYETPMYFIDAGDNSETGPRPLAESTTDGKTVDVSDTSVTELYKHLTECKIAEFDLDPDRENAVYEMAFNFNTSSNEPETFKVNISLMGNKMYEEPDDIEEVGTPGNATGGDAEGGGVTTGKPGNSTKPPVKSGDSESSTKKIIVIILIVIFVLIITIVIAIIVRKRKHVTRVKKKESFNQNSLREGPIYNNTNIGIPIILDVISGDSITKEIHINVDGSLIVGSSEISDLKIDEPSMSNQHFVLAYDGMDFFIMDLESKNGTFLNGERINGQRKLEKNDKIKAGVLDIVVRW